MSTNITTFYFKKTATASGVKSTQRDFGFAVVSTTWANETVKEMVSREWAGEHGEDTYIPPKGLRIQAYDVDVELCYKGDKGTSNAKYRELRSYLLGLDGDGADFIIYDPYLKKGRQKVYVKSISDITAYGTNLDEVLKIKITFRVTDPITEVIAVTNTKQEITNLAPDELAN